MCQWLIRDLSVFQSCQRLKPHLVLDFRIIEELQYTCLHDMVFNNMYSCIFEDYSLLGYDAILSGN